MKGPDADPGATPFKRFESLTRRLVRVPKKEVDALRTARKRPKPKTA
jgi:hypothetical protein